MNWTVDIADCAEIPLPDKSVDLVICSPPYEDARTYGVDFKLKGQDWVDWCVPRFVECMRVSRGLVAWVVEGKTKQFRWSATPALLMADLHRAGVKLRKPPAYHRVGIPGSGGPDWLRNDYEFIVCACKGKLPWSDNTAMGHTPKYAAGGSCSSRKANGERVNQWGHSIASGAGRVTKDGWQGNEGQRPSHRPGSYAKPVKANPGNVVACKVGGGLMGSRLAHENEAPYPEALAEFFIKSFCPPGGLVCDPFCGSGTTLAAAVKSNRRGVGFDIRASQIELTKKRMREWAFLE